MNNEYLVKILEEYKETKKCLESGLNWLKDKDYARGKLEVVNVIIRDLESVLEVQKA